MDRAILSHVKELGLESLSSSYKKVDEIPFDFTRRRMSVVVEDRNGKRQIITMSRRRNADGLQLCGIRRKGSAFIRQHAKQGTEIREGDECTRYESAGPGAEEFPE